MDPSEIQQLVEEAIEALRRGNDVKAGAIADQLTAAAPDDPVARAIRAQTLLAGDNAAEALAEARRAVELKPESVYAHRLLGLAAWRAERLTLAQQSFVRAAELSEHNSEILAEYAWFMAQERGPRLALQAAREALDADSESSTAWAALGVAHYRLRRWNEAETSLRRALELNPNDMYAQSAMAVLLQDQRKDAKAEALVDLLKGVPGTEELVQDVQREAKKRQIAKKLVERQADPDARLDERPQRRSAWLIVIGMMITGLLVLFQPTAPLEMLICVVVPLLIVWGLFRMLD